MAETAVSANDPLSNQLWSRKLYVEALKRAIIMKFVGTDSNSIIQVKDELSKNSGDQVTVGLRMQLNGDGVSGDSTLDGEEEELERYNDSLQINQLRHAVKVVGNMSQQRVPWSIRAEGESGLSDWWAGRMDASGFNQLCGNSVGQTNTKYTGMQVALPPSANRVLFADFFENGAYDTSVAAASSDANVGNYVAGAGATDVREAPFRLELIDRAVVKARTSSPAIRPVAMAGGECYCQFLHPHQTLQLRQNSTSGQWLDIQRAAMTGGVVNKNPIYSGALGQFNNVILHEGVRVVFGNTTQLGNNLGTSLGPAGDSTTNIARSVFCGAQAASIAFGRAHGYQGTEIRFRWTEILKDYDNQLGISAALIWGMKKMVFNSEDFASITVSTYSPGV